MVDFSSVSAVVGNSFFEWLKLFIAPLKNLDMLWIIVPVWGVWLFSEFYQEKKGTSFGNAISNGATMLFVGVDWMRYIIRNISSGELVLGGKSITLMMVAGGVLVYGVVIILLGVKAKGLVRVIGRVRETTYFMVMFSPVIYGVENLSFRIAAIIVAFFPLFYMIVEIIDRLMPTPQTFDLDEEKNIDANIALDMKSPGQGLSSDFSQDVFGSKAGQVRQPQMPPQYRQSYYPPGYPFQQGKGKRPL